MEIAIVFLALSFLLILLFVGFVLIRYHIYLNPQAIRKESVLTQAKMDYQRARGTTHLAILHQAYARTHSQLDRCTHGLATAQNQIVALQQERDEKLRTTLEHQIAYTRLTEIKGIGPKMRDRILATTFRSRLTDLTQAYRVHGVGISKQQVINAWIQEYSRQIPILLTQYFEGKSQITTQYQSLLRELNSQASLLARERGDLQSQLQCLQKQIQGLEQIRIADFVYVLQNPTTVSENLDTYMVGLFPEWGTPPDWFASLSTEEAN